MRYNLGKLIEKIGENRMFKPEYILDNVRVFGLSETIEIIEKKFKRLGKTPRMAYIMARQLVNNTVFIGE